MRAWALLGFSQPWLGSWVAGATQEVDAIVVNLGISEGESGLGHLREQVPKNRNLVEELSRAWTGVPDRSWRPHFTVMLPSLAHTGTLGWAAGLQGTGRGVAGCRLPSSTSPSAQCGRWEPALTSGPRLQESGSVSRRKLREKLAGDGRG